MMQSKRKSWIADVNFWNDAFKDNPTHVMVRNPLLKRIISSLSPGTALDLGCGTGENATALIRRGWQVTGVDWAAHAIELAAARVPDCTFFCDDIKSWQNEKRFDLVVASFSIPEKKKDAHSMLKNAISLIQPGGHLLICEWDKSMENIWNHGVAKKHRLKNLLLSIQEVQEFIKDLKIVRQEIHGILSEKVFPDPHDRRRAHQRYMNMMIVLAQNLSVKSK